MNIKEKGATTTEILVALALGIMILLGLGYLFWQWLGKGSSHVTEQWCRAKEFSYCSVWATCGYKPEDDPTTCKPKTVEGGIEYFDFIHYAPGCEIYSWATSVSLNDAAECKRVLGQT